MITTKNKYHKRNYWTDQEVEFLKAHYSAAAHSKEIAEKLGRSVTEVNGKAAYLGLKRRDRGSVFRTPFSEDEISFIKENFHKMNNRQIAKALGKTLTVVRNKCRELGLLHMELEYWTEEQIEYLKAHYKLKGDSEIAREFNKLWPKKKLWTKKHIDKKRGYLGLRRTQEEQFRIRTGRYLETDYADFNGLNFPQGKKRLWLNNGKFRWMIKVGPVFVSMARFIWEQAHGPIPKGMKILFIDSDTSNCTLANLRLVSQADIGRIIAEKSHGKLSDGYVAGVMAFKNPEMKKILLNCPTLLEAKRQQLLLNRQLGKSKCKVKQKTN